MLFNIVLVSLATLYLETSAQVVLCPNTFPEECTCTNYLHGPLVKCITVPMDTWDVKATFDEISDAINNNNSVMYDITIDAALLGQPQEIEANSISTLKASRLQIFADKKLTRIHPEAFPGAQDTVELMTISQMNFTNSQEAFDLVNNFKELMYLAILLGSLSEIPAHAFGPELQNLLAVNLPGVGLESIGDNAFAGAESLQQVYLYGNKLDIDRISDHAFNFSAPVVYLSLEKNAGITHLPQEKFGNFLNGENLLYVGAGDDNCNKEYFLHCDERVDWICDTDFTRLYGYWCKENEHVDIYGYCQQKFGYSPLDKKSAEERKKVEIEDYFLYKKHQIEQKYFLIDNN